MDVKEFKKKHGIERIRSVCKAAGTDYEYVKQCMNGHRNLGRKTALSLVEKSGEELDLHKLMFPEKSA